MCENLAAGATAFASWKAEMTTTRPNISLLIMSTLARSPITTLPKEEGSRRWRCRRRPVSRAEACSQAAAVDNLGNIFGLMVPDASPAGKTRRHPMTKPPSIKRLKP